ncbi:MAG: PhoH family protein [Phycisphaerae bacterium]
MQLSIAIGTTLDMAQILGQGDRHLRWLRDLVPVSLSARGSNIRISGEAQAVSHAAAVLAELQKLIQRNVHIDREQITALVQQFASLETAAPTAELLDVTAQGRIIEARTPGQKRYLEAIFAHDLVVCTGPAGTGKTYLAVATAVSLLRRNQIRRIVLVRPAVEAGEKLGFLPGDLQAKVNPYLRPLIDALHDMMPYEHIKRFMANDVIELAPLAYMRGRTLNDAIIIMDEAQNTTPAQMLMFLTRLGERSRMIVTGDPTQVDLEPGQQSGLDDAVHRLRRVRGVAHVQLEASDIVRHRLVQKIVDAYTPKPEAACFKP